ncbi:hypothetical protein EZ449_17780 [Pedobacter frigidisoli]|uniref:Glycosyl transferase family 11 n=1 Tax=Pedobacter frigidisoli TaxID=2530455 RepID=A0A4R0NSK9_9SPHI|nr:alpha-1,2-fucosyltransferase [Pedobacter frigidisoli]TCD04161.1 hypothetical protein EZ449_17780 [Pedobacter frigidisoli]
MVIINSQNAMLVNRLWGFSSFIANSIEYDYPLVNLGFYRYKDYFEATKINDFGKFPISIKRWGIPLLDYFYSNLFKNWSSITYRKFGKTPVLHKFYRTTFSEDKTSTIFDLNKKEFINDARTRKILVQGWMFRDSVNVRKHRDLICSFFKPVEPYFSEIKHEIAEAKKLANILIGVHIRRGDYATFVGGKWFYSDEQYAKMMHQIANEYKLIGLSCAFFISSNEEINVAKFDGLTLANKARNFIVDLYSLSECDAIIGPPSTFSQWAAFYGDKPLTMILSPNQNLGIPKYNNAFVADEDFPEKNLYTF